jgi:hypothetical protein
VWVDAQDQWTRPLRRSAHEIEGVDVGDEPSSHLPERTAVLDAFSEDAPEIRQEVGVQTSIDHRPEPLRAQLTITRCLASSSRADGP